MPKIQEVSLLTVPEVAEKLRLHVGTVQNLLKAGKLYGFKIGGRWRVPEDALRKFVSRGEVAPEED